MITYPTDKLQKVLLRGGCEQNGIPTPDNPIDIICNNGVLKVRNKSGLPLGYALLDYIESTGTQYIDTGIVPTNAGGTKVKFRFALNDITSGENQCIGVNNNLNMVAASSLLKFRSNGIEIKDFDTDWHVVEMSKSTTGKTTIFDGATYKSSSTNEYASTFLLFGLLAGNVHFGKYKLSYMEIYDNNVLVRNLIPSRRNSDNVVGMFDLVSQTFFTNKGTGDFIAGANVDDVEIYADGTREVVTDNLGNTANAEMLLGVGDYKDIQSILDGVVTRNVGIKVLDGTEVWQTTEQSFTYRHPSPVLFSIPNTCICSHYVGVNSIVGIAAMPNKSAKAGSSASNIYIKDSSFSSLAGLKQFLADQYTNGTPVIIVYPLVEPTTEQVTPQQLAGSSATVTAGSINNLSIESSTIAELKKRYIGNKEIKRVYIGDNLVYNN